MSQDLYHARKRASSAEERSRRQWCNKRFELSSTTSATLGSDGECLVGKVPKEPETYLDQPSRDLAVVWSASNERAKPSAMECQSTPLGGLRRSLASSRSALAAAKPQVEVPVVLRRSYADKAHSSNRTGR